MAGKRGRGRGDIDTLPGRTQAATKGVQALSGAFNDLSKKGELSASSINQFAGAAAQVNPLLGLLTAAVGATVASFKMLEELDLKDSIMEFGVGARQAVVDFERFAAVTQAGAGQSGELQEKLEDLARAQFALKEKIASVSAEAARQNKLVEEEGVQRELAEAALAAYTRTVREQLPESAEKVENLKKEVEELRKQAAATDRAAEAERRWQTQQDRSRQLFDATQEARRQGGALEAGAVDALEEERFARDELIEEMKHQIETSGHVTATQLELLSSTERHIVALEQQVDLQRRVGAMAESAIGQTAAGAYDAYAEALDKTVSLQALFEKSADRTYRNIAASVVRNLGRQAAVEGAMEAARALASLALRDFEAASRHAAASAAFFGVAAAAGAASGAVSVKGAGGGGGGSRGGGRGDGDGGRNIVIHVTPIGTLDSESARSLASQIAKEIAEGG